MQQHVSLNRSAGAFEGGGITRPRAAVGIVAFNPDPVKLTRLVHAIADGAARVFIYCNSPLQPDLIGALSARCADRLALLGDQTNAGLGRAYNQIVLTAKREAFHRVLLFDQDSLAPENLVADLNDRMDRLRHEGDRPAIVGPLPVSASADAFKQPRVFSRPRLEAKGANHPVEFLISSGSLIDCGAFDAIGPFREDFFIDAVDIEWCLRAWSMGYSCWMATDLKMEHELGAGIIRIPLVNVLLAKQPPRRIYCFIRNQLAMLRLPHVPVRWKIRVVPQLILHSGAQVAHADSHARMLRSVLLGWWDGARGALGPPRD